MVRDRLVIFYRCGYTGSFGTRLFIIGMGTPNLKIESYKYFVLFNELINYFSHTIILSLSSPFHHNDNP